MNKKLWFTGGEPNINADDLRRDSDAVMRALIYGLNAWLVGTNQNYIIYGCDVTITPGVEASVTDGYILLNGEILQVDAHTCPAGSTDFYMYEKQTSYDPNGDKIFKDLVSRRTWQINRGVLVNAPSKPVPLTNLDAEGADWPEKIRNRIKGDYLELTPGDHDLSGYKNLNYVKLDLSESASTYTITIRDASDEIHENDINFIFFWESDPLLPRCTYEFRDVHGTLIATNNKPGFFIYINDGGVWKLFVYIDLDIQNGDPPLQEINIPEWNMDTDNSMTISHTLMDKNAIKKVTARIYNDAGDTLYSYECDGQIRWTDTDIILNHSNQSIFDSADFNGTGFDRGKLYIQI